jgi:hypothetical protein
VVRQCLVFGTVQDGLAYGRVTGPGPVHVVIPEVLDVFDGSWVRAGWRSRQRTTHVWNHPSGLIAQLWNGH